MIIQKLKLSKQLLKNKHLWVVNIQKRCLCLSLRGQTCIQNSSCLQWEWEEEEESEPGILSLSAKGRTSSCWNCEWGRGRGGWVGILPQKKISTSGSAWIHSWWLVFLILLKADFYLLMWSLSLYFRLVIQRPPKMQYNSKAPIKSIGQMQPSKCNRVNQDFQPKHVLEKMW